MGVRLHAPPASERLPVRTSRVYLAARWAAGEEASRRGPKLATNIPSLKGAMAKRPRA